MTKTMPPPHRGPAVVQTLHQHDRTYEQRYVDCGKEACTRCGGTGERHPSHGPYWYLCVPRRHRWYRVYLGKVLDLAKYVLPNGDTDWAQITRRRLTTRERVSRADRSPPGEPSLLDYDSDVPPDSPSRARDPDPHDPGPVPPDAPPLLEGPDPPGDQPDPEALIV